MMSKLLAVFTRLTAKRQTDPPFYGWGNCQLNRKSPLKRAFQKALAIFVKWLKPNAIRTLKRPYKTKLFYHPLLKAMVCLPYRESLINQALLRTMLSQSFRVTLISFFLFFTSCKQISEDISNANTSPTPYVQKSRPGVYVPNIPDSLNRTQSSEHFRAHFSPRTKTEDVKLTLEILEDARKKMTQRLADVSLNIEEVPVCVVIIHDTTGNFTGDTKQSWLVGAVTRGISITLQPIGVLKKRNTLETILHHEYVHVIVNALRQKQIPRWMNEGTALHYSGEGRQLLKTEKKLNITKDEIEKRLDSQPKAAEMRVLYAASYREVTEILKVENEAGLWKQITEK